MTPTEIATDIVYSLPCAGYAIWTPAQRDTVAAFLRDHDIDPGDVSVTEDNHITVRVAPSGLLELSVWVHDREDGQTVNCPTCPACARQTRVTRELKTAVPHVSGAWIGETFRTRDES